MSRTKKIFAVAILFLSSAMAFSLTAVQDVFFELTRQCVCGVSSLSVSGQLVEFSRPAADFFTRPVWREKRRYPLMLIEILCPEKQGVLDATFSRADLLSPAETGDSPASPDWVDAVLLAAKMRTESESAPEHFDVAEQMLSEMDNRDEGGIVEGQDAESKEPVEMSFTDSSGRLRRFSYGEEHFSVRETDGQKTIVDNAAGLTVRRFFDGQNRMTKKERFMIGSSAKDIKLLSSRTYAYREESILPFQMTEEITDGKKRNVTEYDERGLAISLETSHYVEQKAKKKDEPPPEPRLVKDTMSRWTYDDAKRMTEEEIVTYFYSKTATGREKIEKDTIKKQFHYGASERHPDVSYYENGELRIRTVYESENVYNETMYFDGGFVVQTRYENSVKKSEVISVDGIELRRRTFEN